MAHEILSVKMYELDKKLEQTHGRRSHRYASFLRLAYEEIILRQYSRNLIFDVLEMIT